MTWIRYFCFSAALHFAIAMLISNSMARNGSHDPGGKSANKQSKGKNKGGDDDKVSITLIPKATTKGKGRKCKDWYGGIGLTHDGFNGAVLTVPRGYPAWKAGLKPGDLVFHMETLRGKPGTKVELKWLRGSKLFTKIVIREKICNVKKKD